MDTEVSTGQRTSYNSGFRTVCGTAYGDPEGGVDRQGGADEVDDHPSPAADSSNTLPVSGHTPPEQATVALRDTPLSGWYSGLDILPVSGGPLQAPPLQAVVFPLRTGVGGNAREAHWSQRSKRVRSEREVVAWEVMRGKLLAPRPEQYPLTVCLGRHGPTRGLDSDNLQQALKPTRDEVARMLGVDDGDPSVQWVYTQSRMQKWHVSVEVRCHG